MSVKIRLSRRGRKKLALYDITIADSRSPRDGKFIEKIGSYNPNTNPATITINDEKALEWLANGAIPTNTVRAILSYKGILLKRHLQIGVDKKAISQEEADKKYNKWIKEKEKKIQDKVDSILKLSEEEKSKRLEAEKQASKKRADDIVNKEKEKLAKAEEEAKTEEAPKEEVKEEETKTEEAPKEEVKEEETKTEEAPKEEVKEEETKT
ncbi:MAG: 30S ribosomal protein S16, partial [Flammeovirgaceae bacterium]|nr:30S ribosomal protein S16 [Flammeovirgaceae bacterium]